MRKLILFIAITLSQTGFTQFGPEQILDSSVFGSYIPDMLLTDMNNDGYIDMVTAQQGATGKVTVYFNDLKGGFGSGTIMSTNSNVNKAANVGDFNADGWMDVVAASQGGIITTYINNNGNSFSQLDVVIGVVNSNDLLTADFINDGYTDFVTLSNMTLDVYMNDKNSNFIANKIDDSTEFYSICTGDIDGDGDSDIISGSGRLFTYFNDGNGSFTYSAINELASASAVNLAELADMDEDGDLDLVVYYNNVIDRVDWYSNKGQGEFTFESTITSFANNLYSISIEDLDNDGKLDVYLGYDQMDELVWIKNLGNGNFSSENSINSTINVVMRTAIGDIDNDGDNDVFFSASGGMFYHLNTTHTVGFDSKELPIISIYPNPAAHNQFFIGGLNIENTKVLVVDALGKTVNWNLKYCYDRIEVNTQNSISGVYFIYIQSPNQKQVKTLFIK